MNSLRSKLIEQLVLIILSAVSYTHLNANIIGVGFDKSDAIMNLINDGYLLCTMAQNPDVMGEDGVKAAVAALEGQDQGGKVTDTGVSVIKK